MKRVKRYCKRISRKFKRPSAYCLIHIGKCGGTSLRSALERSAYCDADVVHMKKPKFRSNTRYLIVARDPIARCFSAFNWRYKLVVKEEEQKARLKGEYKILRKYETLSNLASSLYDENSELVEGVARDFDNIYHLHERISYYLEDFLNKCPQSSIIDVLMTETLTSDIERVLEVNQTVVVHEKKNKAQTLEKLNGRAKTNLVRYIENDYKALAKLHSYGFIEPSLMQTMFQNANLNLGKYLHR